MEVATNSSYAATFGTAGSNALVLLLLDTQHYGTVIAQVFFGLWLVPLGYLAYRSSGMFPGGWRPAHRGSRRYVVDLLAAFSIPDLAAMIHPFVGILVPAIAEISMLLYLLIIGVKIDEKTRKPGERILAAA